MPILNRCQREAASFLFGTCAVVAVPGSGKTLTMTERIVTLVRKQGIAPERIVGLTFTRNAAQAMRTGLQAALGSRSGRVTLATIHSFCYSLLKRETGQFTLLAGRKQLQFLRGILREFPLLAVPAGSVLREISLARGNLLSPGEFRILHENDPDMRRISQVMEIYEREKANKRMLDFDDLLGETCRILRGKPHAGEKYRKRFRHILVDEFQDTNPALLEVIRILHDESDPVSSLWVCGDDWQSIYAFTGASMGNLLGFRTMYPRAAVLTLSENYRSTPQILAACGNLMRHNTRKLDKPLRAVQPDGTPVRVLESYSEVDEAAALASEIETLHAGGCPYQDIAVLYRSNFQSRVIEEAFLRLGIPYRSEQGTDFYRRPEVCALADYLRCVLDPESENGARALRNVIDIPYRGLGKSFLRQLESLARRKGISLFRGLREMEIPNHRQRKSVDELCSLIESISREAGSIPPAELIGKLRQSIRYDRFFAEEEIPGPDDARIQNINQFQFAAAGYDATADFLVHIDRLAGASKEGRGNGVRLMTVHRSKGLEFSVVFVAGMTDGIFPSGKGDIEEERRICFVAISRAKRKLFLSYTHTCFGRPVRRSQFIDEILEERGEQREPPNCSITAVGCV